MLNRRNIPSHIAIIMDGNGRWAEKRGLPRTAGHREGLKRVREVIKTAGECGVGFLTLFAFSTENWVRPKKEIDMLMHALVGFLGREGNLLHKKNIRLLVIGRKEPLPGYVQDKIAAVVEKTKANTGLTVVLALNYGGRQEITDAARKIAEAAVRGEMNPADLDIAKFSSFLYNADLPDPEFLIRTSGEMRLSNFLLWQLSYAELYFLKIHWPDFGADAFKNAIQAYQKRERRFGGIKC